MTLLAILQRELRLEARRPHNYWLRVLGAALMAFVFMGLVTRDDKSAALLGARLFPHFHIILFATVSLIAPLLTADCLATERREGTLDLLLLTRLTSGGIVAAKTLVHALRGLALMLAALPVFCLPFLIGGVSPTETIISVLICVSVLMLGLAGGVAASAVTQAWARATLLALVLGYLLCALFSGAYCLCFERWIVPPGCE